MFAANMLKTFMLEGGFDWMIWAGAWRLLKAVAFGLPSFCARTGVVSHSVEEMKQYDLMRSGDISAISESTRL